MMASAVYSSNAVALVFCVLILGVHNLDVTVRRTSITALQGTTLEFNCYYLVPENQHHMTVQWFKRLGTKGPAELLWTTNASADALESKVTAGGYDISNKFNSSINELPALLYGHTLELIDVDLQDEGNYICVVEYFTDRDVSADKGSSPYIVLIVHVPPDPTFSAYTVSDEGHQLSVNEVEEGQQVILECKSPPVKPAYVEISIHLEEDTINCTRPEHSQTDIIVCRSYARLFRSHNRFHAVWYCGITWWGSRFHSPAKELQILFPPSSLSMTSPFPTAVVPLTRAFVTCTTDSSNPPATILWRENLKFISGESDYYNETTGLVITSASEMGDFYAFHTVSTLSVDATLQWNDTMYDCVLMYKTKPIMISVNSTLVLKGPDAIIHGNHAGVRPGDNLTLMCRTDQADFAKTQNLTWSFKPANATGARNISKTNELHETNVDHFDEGTYTCIIVTEYGSGRSSVHVNFSSGLVYADAVGPFSSPAAKIGLASGGAAALIALVAIIAVAVLLAQRRKGPHNTDTQKPDKREWTDLNRISGFVYGAHTNPDKTCGFVYGSSNSGGIVTSGFVYGTPEKTIRTYGMGITNPDNKTKSDNKNEVADKTSKSSILSGKVGSMTKKTSPGNKNKVVDKTSKSSVASRKASDNTSKVFDKTSRSSILSGKGSDNINNNNNAQNKSRISGFWRHSSGFKKYHSQNYVSILPENVMAALRNTKQAEMFRNSSDNSV